MHFDVTYPFVDGNRWAMHKRLLELPRQSSGVCAALLDLKLVLGCRSLWCPVMSLAGMRRLPPLVPEGQALDLGHIASSRLRGSLGWNDRNGSDC